MAQISVPTSNKKEPNTPHLDRDGKQRMIVVLVSQLLVYAVLFLAAGTFEWASGWLFVTLTLACYLTAGLYVASKNPGVINERGRKSDKTQPWDNVFAWVYAPMVFMMPLIAGLDFRFGWSEMALPWQVVGVIGMVPGMLLPYWAMRVNDFLVTTARLQDERGQYVVTSGPYRFVRHPMYAGGLLYGLCSPLVLGTWWALIPAGIAAAAMLGRTILEDRMLQNGLAGYPEYVEHVRYRLIPGIW